MAIASTGRAQGFTLMELLVVITIIAVLASMLMPAINMVRTQARRSVCGNQMRQVGMGVVSYRTDNEGLYPSVYWNVNNDYSTNSWSSWVYKTDQGRWQHALEAFTGTYKVFNCPETSRFYPNAAVRDYATPTVPRGSSPANGVGTWSVCLTAINSKNYAPAPTPSNPTNMSDPKIDAFISQNQPTARRNRCPVVFDGVWQNDGTNQRDNVSWGYFFPHRQATNAVFDDGHVEFRTYKEFTTFAPVVQVAE